MTPLKVDWQPAGVFALNGSNNHVGSLYSIEDMMSVLSIPANRREDFSRRLGRHQCLNSEGRVIEPKLHKKKKFVTQKTNLWKIIVAEMGLPTPPAWQTLSELELIAIIKKTYGDEVVVDTQQRIGAKFVDIKAHYKEKDVYIEFLGPNHFNETKIEADRQRIEEIKQQIKSNNYSIIEWPYWIQLCETNVRVAFGEDLKGRGAIWGSEITWGGVSEEVRNRIVELTNSFHAINDDGIGYFYEEWKDSDDNTIKPAHPIIKKIMNEEYKIDVLIPQGVYDEDRKFWLPKELWYKL